MIEDLGILHIFEFGYVIVNFVKIKAACDETLKTSGRLYPSYPIM